MIVNMRKTILTILVLFSIGNIAWANGSHGQYFEKATGEYTIGVGTDVYALVAGDPIRFDFNLYKKESKEPVEFSDIWVRIVEKTADSFDRTVFAGGLYNPQIGYAGMTSNFATQGDYELIVRFNNKAGDAITDDVSLPLVIEANPDGGASGSLRDMLLGVVIGIVFGFGGALFLKFLRKKPASN
jgi:hypothetical protein